MIFVTDMNALHVGAWKREGKRVIIFGLITNPKGYGAFYTIKPQSYKVEKVGCGRNIGSQFVLKFLVPRKIV